MWQDVLRRFADEELEVKRLYYNASGGPVTTNNYGNVVSPSRIDYKVI